MTATDTATRFPAAIPGPSERPGWTERLAVVSGRRSRRVLAVWLFAVVVALGFAATSLHGLTSTGKVVTPTASSRAEALYARASGVPASERPTDVIVVSSTNESVGDPALAASVDRLGAEVAAMPGVTGVRVDLARGNPLVSPDGHAAVIDLTVASDSDIRPVVAAVRSASVGDISVAVTGVHTVGNDFATLSASGLQHGEIDFGLPIALVVLLLLFGAVVAGLTPVLMALVAIAVGLGLATLVAQEFSLSVFLVNMMTGMGLALGIDYSLFVISRFREERSHGADHDEAIRRTGATAGRAVLFSGGTFAVALSAMLIVPTNVMRSLAAGAIIVGVVSVAAALTLLPALLRTLGDRVDALALPVVGRRLNRPDRTDSRFWRTFVTRVMGRPALSLVLAAGAMLVLASLTVGLHIGESGVATLPNSLPSKQGYLALQRNFADLTPNPVEIVAVGGGAAGQHDVAVLEQRLAGDRRFGPGSVVGGPDSAIRTLTVPIEGDPVSGQAMAAVRQLRAVTIPAIFAGSSARVLVGGATADAVDYVDAVTTPTPVVLGLVLAISFLLLLVAFRSLVVALLSIALNLLSAGAAFGLLTLVFVHGVGASVLGFRQVSEIDAWVPLFLFSVLFALSMDYQVFIMSRIREHMVRHGDPQEAVVSGVTATARIVTGAALIIVVVFAGFARGQLVMFQEMGFGVAVALLLDATVVRMVILPSALGLLGHRAWSSPAWLNRLLPGASH